MNAVEVYQRNTLNLGVEITNEDNIELSGYTPIIVIDFKTEEVSLTGSTITNNETIFSISSDVNDVPAYIYSYEVYITDGNNKYTVVADAYAVLPSIV